MANDYKKLLVSDKDIDVIPYGKDASILKNDACTEDSGVVRKT